jgi:hypothetical protein
MFSRIKPGIAEFCVFAAVAMALALTGTVGAETWKARDLKYTIARAGLRIGPFRIQPVLYLTDAGYDSNIYGQTDRPVRDYWLQAGPGVSVYLPFRKKIVFSLTESPRYVYFFNTARERAWNNYLKGDVSFLFNKIFLNGGFIYNNYKYRYPFEIDIWPRLKETGAFGSILYQVSKRTSFSVAARTTSYAFENLEAEPEGRLPDDLGLLPSHAAGHVQRQRGIRPDRVRRSNLELRRFAELGGIRRDRLQPWRKNPGQY